MTFLILNQLKTQVLTFLFCNHGNTSGPHSFKLVISIKPGVEHCCKNIYGLETGKNIEEYRT